MPWITPEIITTLAALILILFEAFSLLKPPHLAARLSLSALAIATLITLLIPTHTQTYWSEQYLWNDSVRLIKTLFLLLGLGITFLALKNPQEIAPRIAEFHALLLLALTGLLLLPSSQNFLTLFVSLELITVTLYILISYHRTQITSLEAGIKYLIIGGIASAFLIMGTAYLFGFTGSLNFNTIAAHPVWTSAPPPLWIAVFFIFAGVAFKAGLVPFHAWAPDVYQGANNPTTALLATASKAAGILLLYILFNGPLRLLLTYPQVTHTILILATLSIIIGNFSALHQHNIKRLLAYSGIGHAGYITLPLAHFDPAAQTALLTYLLAYLLASITAFTIIPLVTPTNHAPISAYTGLAQRHPLHAIALTLALTSMAGIPPLVGFTGKWLIFACLWQHKQYLILTLALISAIVALAYYLSIIKTLFTPPSPTSITESSSPIPSCPVTLSIIALLSLALLVLGLWPQPLLHIVFLIAR
jgi:NADH-quinone oxidoreductase subunit N